MTKIEETEAKMNAPVMGVEKAATVLLVLMDKEHIKAGQDSIRKTVVSLDMDVHANAVQCLLHAKTHGDTSLMTRLLVEILDDKTGYRRQGLIGWIRTFSPMELDGKKITLTGVDADGNKRPFLVERANDTPFYSAKAFAEKVIKPVFQETLLSKTDTMVKEFEESWANTKEVGGALVAINAKQAYYLGTPTAAAKMLAFVAAIKTLRENVGSDDSRVIYLAEQRLAQDAKTVAAAKTKAA